MALRTGVEPAQLWVKTKETTIILPQHINVLPSAAKSLKMVHPVGFEPTMKDLSLPG